MSFYLNDSNSRIVEFGKGDVGVCLVDHKGKTQGVCFYPVVEQLPVNTEFKTPKKEPDHTDLIFFFTKIESIDVVINKLQELKTEMLKNKQL